jgi:hypothetical protein
MDGEVVTPQAPSPTLQRRHASAEIVKPRVVAIAMSISSVCIMIRVRVPIIRMRAAGHIGAVRELFLIMIMTSGSSGRRYSREQNRSAGFLGQGLREGSTQLPVVAVGRKTALGQGLLELFV